MSVTGIFSRGSFGLLSYFAEFYESQIELHLVYLNICKGFDFPELMLLWRSVGLRRNTMAYKVQLEVP